VRHYWANPYAWEGFFPRPSLCPGATKLGLMAW